MVIGDPVMKYGPGTARYGGPGAAIEGPTGMVGGPVGSQGVRGYNREPGSGQKVSAIMIGANLATRGGGKW